MRGLARIKAQAALPERDPNTIPQDKVIQHVDVEQLACGNDLVRHQNILNIYMENHLTV